MSQQPVSRRFSRRQLAAILAATPLAGQQVVPTPITAEQRRTTAGEVPPFRDPLTFTRSDVKPRVRPFPMTHVRLLAGPHLEAEEWNRAYLHRLPVDRLVHNFRTNAGLSSSAQPLGGWEEPKGELRGHFTGHFLSACALTYASTGDKEAKTKGDEMVAELARCQAKLGGGYLSAFPTEFFDRLNRREKVWAPFYTVHKIMAGMLDMHQHCDNKQALEVIEGMANWADTWSAPHSEGHMQDILNTEYGGMNDIHYKLAAVTGDARWAKVGDRFTKKKFFNPLALRRDELRGLHVNTHIPQVIGAASRYELSGDVRFHDVADYFWYEVTSARAYCTGGTSNDEGWLTQPRHLAEELKRSTETAECCCAYNMLKLTRQLYTWTADPRYFDYYERVQLNHRLGAIRPETGATMYYLSLTPGAYKTFGSEDKSFWCCTGTGVEEFAKLNDSIYFHDDGGLYVNLFVASELDWREKGVRIRQETKFPEQPNTTLRITAANPVQTAIRLRIPEWAAGATVKINGKAIEASAAPSSYLALNRTWRSGDRIDLELPMRLHIECMPDDPRTQAFLYGPVVLAGDLGTEGLTPQSVTGAMGPRIEEPLPDVPAFHAATADPAAWIKPEGGKPLTFRTTGQKRDVSLAPLASIFDKRYSVYWQVS